MSFLNEIRKNAGEVDKTTNENISTKMNTTKSKIVRNTGLEYVVEMAQQHFDNEILDLILQGKHHEAADRYIHNQAVAGYRVPPKADATVNKLIAGAFAKGFKGSKEKVEQIKKEDWDKFKEAYQAVIAGDKDIKPRERVKAKGKKDASGQVRTAAVSQEKTAKKLRNKVVKLRDEALARMNAATDPEEKDDHENHAEALNTMLRSLEYTIAGRATLPPDTDEKLQKIKDRYKKIGLKYQEPAKEPDEDDEDYEEPYATDAEREEAHRRLEQRRRDRYRWDESLNLKGKILAESFEYTGQNFWKNYTMTSLVKAFAKDYKVFKEETKYIYAQAFGVSGAPIFEYLEENAEVLNEVVKIKAPLLFEDYGYNALMEMETAGLGTPASAIAKKSFLAGLWDKVKKFGGPIVGRLAGLLSSGVSWAKNIAQQGLGWIATNPIAQVAVPAVVLAGSAVGAVKLINRMRRKKGERKLDKQEQEEIKRMAVERSDEIEKQSRKIKADPPRRSSEPADEMDDEEDLVSDEER